MNDKMNKTPVILHLHTHMPYVMNHDMWPHGTVWLSEVVCESYLPILEVIQDLHQEGIRPTLSFDFSPILLAQLSHSNALSIFTEYVKQQIEQSEKDLDKFSKIPEAVQNIPMGEFWKSFYEERLQTLHGMNDSSIIERLRIAEQDGLIEIMTCGLTHAYLPLLDFEQSTRMQIASSVKMHELYFAHKPRAIFLPECGYAPKLIGENGEYYLEDIILEQSINMIILDQQHSMKYVESEHDVVRILPESLRPLSQVRLQKTYKNQSLKVLIRHKSASDKVWSEKSGYPSHSAYLDFHKREFDSTLRYWKVTNHPEYTQEKYPYMMADAKKQAQIDAKEYVEYLEELALSYSEQVNETGVICLAFDTELFGHWWFEGPEFLSNFIREMDRSDILSLKFPSEIQWNDSIHTVQCSAGSWGMNGTDETWKNASTMWLLDNIHDAEQRFEDRVHSIDINDQLEKRIMDQALRELLLMQASDWPFLITKNQASDYAKERFMQHQDYFTSLIAFFDLIKSGKVLTNDQETLLARIVQVDDIFQTIDIHRWRHHSA
jgi:1,4-alpha-glucan branching enzyme